MNLEELSNRFVELKSNLLHGDYQGDFLDNHVIEVISTEILTNFNDLSSEDIRKYLVNMFFLGQCVK